VGSGSRLLGQIQHRAGHLVSKACAMEFGLHGDRAEQRGLSVELKRSRCMSARRP
jgi:hypothetical protein